MSKDEKDRGTQRSRYKPGNMAPDGSYIIGKGRPPKETQFAKGDGRKRGRRPKGQKNFDTEFVQEAMRMVTIREGGKERKVSKYRAAAIRALDNAGARGSNPAIRTVLDQGLKIEARRQRQERQPADDRLEADQRDLLDAWIEQKIAERATGANPGDAQRKPDEGTDADDE